MTASLGGVLVLASGCAGATTAASPSASTAAVPMASASPARVVTIVVPKARTAAPGLANTGTSWPAILASLAGYGQWLLANPDPAKIATIAELGCGEANLLSDQINGLLGSNLYVQPSPVVFTTVTGPSPVTAGAVSVTLDVVASRPAEPVLNLKGKQISTYEAMPLTTMEITLSRGSDQKWRFCTIEAMTDAGAPDDPSVALL